MTRRRTPRVPRNRFSKKPVEPTPKFSEGDVAGGFTVKQYIGYGKSHRATGKLLRCEHHWYDVQCECGNMEVHTQQQLIDTRRGRVCAECTAKRQSLHT